MPNFRRRGPNTWVNVHATEKADLNDLVEVLNPSSNSGLSGTGILRTAGETFEQLIQEAAQGQHRLRGLGAGWALTDIAVTDGWLLDTKSLNGRFNVSSSYAATEYPEEKLPFLVCVQCGTSVAELTRFLEMREHKGHRRTLKTAGIGAGQTLVGAVSGNTHGSAVKVGAMPDFVVGLQLVNGTGRPIWLERASQPIMSPRFMEKTGSRLVRDDSLFDAALVSFGAFGMITAMAIETDPLYQLKFDRVQVTTTSRIKERLRNFDLNDPVDLHHYEFVYDPYEGRAMEAVGVRVPFEREFPTPEPRWLVRGSKGFAPGNLALKLAWNLPGFAKAKAKFQFDQYRKMCILDNVQGTPGQLFTATITYSEGMTESAFAVSINDAPMVMNLSSRIVKEMKIPVIAQVRVVHPTKALLGFTRHEPLTVIFEFGLADGPKYREFEQRLTEVFGRSNIPFTFHWSKNSGLTEESVRREYGSAEVNAWLAARSQLFNHDGALMELFSNEHLKRSGLAGGMNQAQAG